MKRFSILFSSALLLASCSSTSPTDTAATPIKIGFIGPLTGDVAALGTDILHGAQLKLKEINETGGINGRLVEIIAEDGRCAGADAAAAAQKLISIDKVVAIHGGECSGETLAAAPIAEAAKVVMLSPSSSNPDVTNAGSFIFRNYPSDALKTVAMAQYFAENDFTNVAILTENSDFTMGFRDSLKENLGGTAVVVFDELVDPGTKDFRTLITRLVGAEFDVIVLNLNSPAAIAIALQQIREQNLTQAAISHDLGDSIEIPQLIGTAAEGFQVINVPTLDAETAFGKKFTAAYGQPQSNLAWGGYGYDVLGILAQAIAEAGTDGTAIREYLYAMPSYKGIIADVSFDENGDVIGIPYVLREVREGEIVTVRDIEVD